MTLPGGHRLGAIIPDGEGADLFIPAQGAPNGSQVPPQPGGLFHGTRVWGPNLQNAGEKVGETKQKAMPGSYFGAVVFEESYVAFFSGTPFRESCI